MTDMKRPYYNPDKFDSGGPSYPCETPHPSNANFLVKNKGKTIWDECFFAAVKSLDAHDYHDGEEAFKSFAEDAAKIADAMMEERKKRGL